MDVIDLSITSENVIRQELAALDPSGEELFECSAIPEADVAAESQDADTELVQDDILVNHTPAARRTRLSIEMAGQRRLVRNIAISHIPPGKRESPESMEERLERISRELQELSKQGPEELGARNTSGLQYTKSLHLKLTQVSSDRLSMLRSKLLREPCTTDGAIDVSLPHLKLDGRDTRRLLELDRRISRLERVVGPTESLGKSLSTRLDEFESQCELLCRDSQTLEKFHKRLHDIEDDYQNSLLGRKSKNSATLFQRTKDGMVSEESQINDLYRFNDLLQAYGPILPRLTDRVRQISGIDDKVSECFELARATDSCIQDLQEQAQQWEQVTNDLEQKLATQEADLAKNREHFNQLLVDLERKVKASR